MSSCAGCLGTWARTAVAATIKAMMTRRVAGRMESLQTRSTFPVSRFSFPGRGSHPRAPKPSPAPLARRQLRHLLELHHLHPLKHELRDARPARHHHRLRAKIDHRDHPLAAIVRIDGGRGVGKSETVLQREPRARPHLRFVAVRYRER